MKNKPFPFFLISLLLFLAVNSFPQNKSMVSEDASDLFALNRASFSANKENIKKAPTAYAEFEKQAFELINKQRKASGLKELIWSDEVAEVARLHSQNMANLKFFSHRGPDGLSLDERADSLGVKKWLAIGENIAYNSGYGKPIEYAVDSWMKSSKHRDNILNRGWNESGIGIAVSSNGSYYFTQVFLIK